MKDVMSNILELVLEDILCATLFVMALTFTPIFVMLCLLSVDTGMASYVTGITASSSILALSLVVKFNQHMTRLHPIHF